MNYFAHAIAFLDRPYFAAGTAVPDWLMVLDRRLRLRKQHAQAYTSSPGQPTKEVASGILQHLNDDILFHRTKAFLETSSELTAIIRDSLDKESGRRPAFLGHVLTELLLDAALIAESPALLTEYYRTLASLNSEELEHIVNQIAPKPAVNLAFFVDRFRKEQVLWDYLHNSTLCKRLNQVLHRARFKELPGNFADMLPAARILVTGRKFELLQITNLPSEHAEEAEGSHT
ncbi:MAG TPA: hypothetical protein PLP17_12130 [Oligoflexia bacterium]|nr:hypothetical protein [Oligoflexia bacterium]